MTDRRCKNFNWTVRAADKTDGACFDGAKLAVLMDIRDAIQEQTGVLRDLRMLAQCKNIRLGFIAMQKVRAHLERLIPAKPKRKRKAVATRRKR